MGKEKERRNNGWIGGWIEGREGRRKEARVRTVGLLHLRG